MRTGWVVVAGLCVGLMGEGRARACSYPSCFGMTLSLSNRAELTGAPPRGAVAFPAQFCTGYPYTFTVEGELARKRLWVRPVDGDWLVGTTGYREDLRVLTWEPAQALQHGVTYELFWWEGQGPPAPVSAPPDAGVQVLEPNAVFKIAEPEDTPVAQEPRVLEERLQQSEWQRSECCVPADGLCPEVRDGCSGNLLDAGPACLCWAARYEYPASLHLRLQHPPVEQARSVAGVYRLVRDDGVQTESVQTWFHHFGDQEYFAHAHFQDASTRYCYRFEYLRLADGAVTEFPWHCLDTTAMHTVPHSTPASRPDRCDAPSDTRALPTPGPGCTGTSPAVMPFLLLMLRAARRRSRAPRV